MCGCNMVAVIRTCCATLSVAEAVVGEINTDVHVMQRPARRVKRSMRSHSNWLSISRHMSKPMSPSVSSSFLAFLLQPRGRAPPLPLPISARLKGSCVRRAPGRGLASVTSSVDPALAA
eukprot:358752-Chlamydomonas_euryale.AAC.4